MKMGLTGRQRYRIGFRGKVILQVEERVLRLTFSPFTTEEWRDANVHDFNLLNIKTPDPCPGQAQDSSTEKLKQ